ncbi:MAG: ABC transporter ATP-binding protein [Chitinivibrionia bacterium]|nr:ABC transporter ATP-binding protein [Chitinivibrionia bacterium]
MINVSGICKKFERKEILNDVTFSVSSGEILGLVGLNGVGKTTLLRLILGILNADGGFSQIFGEILTPKNSKILRKVGIILESDGFNGNFSFVENMQFFAKIKGVNDGDLQKYLDENWEFLQKNANPIKQFSKGERMQCAIARAFLGEPKAIILDEPTTGLDYEQCDKFFAMVKSAQKNGAAIIISSHNFFALDKLCGKVIELKNAKIKDISDGFFNNI